MTNRRANLLLVAMVIVACLAVLEFAAGIMFKRAQDGNSKRLVLSAITSHGRFVGVTDGYIIPHPYLLYTPRPGFEQFGFRQINSLGYRGHEFPYVKQPGTYRILCLEYCGLGHHTMFSQIVVSSAP